MSLWDYFNTNEDTNEILNDIRTGIANLAAQDGETELTNDTSMGVLHSYISVPQTGSVLAVPAGTLTVDFENGRATHTALSGEKLTTDFAAIDELSTDAENLRSLAMGVDTPGRVALDDNDKVPIKSGEYRVNAQRFREVTYETNYPAAVVLGASTRAQPHVDADTSVRTSRYGTLDAGTHDDWTAVPVFNPNLVQFVDDASQFADPRFAVGGNDLTTLTVVNTSANSIDARVLADETDGDDFREIGDVTESIPSGDHATFNVSEAHRLLKVELQNSTNGETVSGALKVHGRGA